MGIQQSFDWQEGMLLHIAVSLHRKFYSNTPINHWIENSIYTWRKVYKDGVKAK